MKQTILSAILIFITAVINTATAQENTTPAETSTLAATTGSVARASFTSSIQNREPSDTLDQLHAPADRIYFFTELKDFQGQTVKHRWTFNGQPMAEISFNVGAPRWRVWSNKQLITAWAGEWKVEVVDANGATLETKSFSYHAATAQPPNAETPATPQETLPQETLQNDAAADNAQTTDKAATPQ